MVQGDYFKFKSKHGKGGQKRQAAESEFGRKQFVYELHKMVMKGDNAHRNFCLVEPFGSVTVQAYAVVVDGYTSLSFRAHMFLLKTK